MSTARSNQEWLHDLKASGMAQEVAINDLRQILLRAALYFFSRNLSDFGGLTRDEILQRAEDCAQDALIAVMSHLSDFRGDSKFSTWAYKFAINISLMAARRERWKGVSLDELAETGEGAFVHWIMTAESGEATPEQSAIQEEARVVIRDVIEHELTDKQRRVLILMVFKEVPLDNVVEYMGANRNSIYKLLHDARYKLKRGLQSRGFEVDETLAVFATSR